MLQHQQQVQPSHFFATSDRGSSLPPPQYQQQVQHQQQQQQPQPQQQFVFGPGTTQVLNPSVIQPPSQVQGQQPNQHVQVFSSQHLQLMPPHLQPVFTSMPPAAGSNHNLMMPTTSTLQFFSQPQHIPAPNQHQQQRVEHHHQQQHIFQQHAAAAALPPPPGSQGVPLMFLAPPPHGGVQSGPMALPTTDASSSGQQMFFIGQADQHHFSLPPNQPTLMMFQPQGGVASLLPAPHAVSPKQQLPHVRSDTSTPSSEGQQQQYGQDANMRAIMMMDRNSAAAAGRHPHHFQESFPPHRGSMAAKAMGPHVTGGHPPNGGGRGGGAAKRTVEFLKPVDVAVLPPLLPTPVCDCAGCGFFALMAKHGQGKPTDDAGRFHISAESIAEGRALIDELRRDRIDRSVAVRLSAMSPHQINCVRGVLECDPELVYFLCEAERGRIVCSILERCGGENCPIMMQVVSQRFLELARSQRGCIAIPRIANSLRDEMADVVFSKCIELLPRLACDRYGNYVCNHFVNTGREEYIERMATRLSNHPELLSAVAVDKYGSYVMDELLKKGSFKALKNLLDRIFLKDEAELRALASDACGNYIVQAAFDAMHREGGDAAPYAAATWRVLSYSPFAINIARRIKNHPRDAAAAGMVPVHPVHQ